MSENIPSTSAKKTKRKHQHHYDQSIKLPTPPPDPRSENSDDFLTYLDSLQQKSSNILYSRSNSAFAPAIATEDAFDHLEKLYKLMEQLLELREQNARLHRRVRDLEHLNNLEKMHRNMTMMAEGECPELDKDTAFAETILESILSETKIPKTKPSKRLRQSISRRYRHRSGSVTISSDKPDTETKTDRRASTCIDSRIKKPTSKVSKWTKVKAAFKWEKASPTVGDAKSQDSGIEGVHPVEVARYLRVPSTCDEYGHSPADSGTAEVSTPGTLSTSSSVDDFHRHDQRSPCEDFKSSDDEHSHNYIPHSKEGSQKSNKSYKTPWAKMKDMIHTKNSFKKKHRLSGHSDDIQIDVELCSDNEDNVFEDDDNRSKLSSSPRIDARDYKREDSREVPPDIVARYQEIIAHDNVIDSAKISKWTKVKQAFLSSPEPQSVTEITSKQIQEEIQKDYRQLQKKLSLEFHDKMLEWERLKQNSPIASNPSSACGFTEDTRDNAFMKKMEEWERIKSQPSIKKSQMTSEGNLPPEFRKKLQEWEKIRKMSNREYQPKKKLVDVPRWKSLSGSKSEHAPVFEYPPLSDDFKKKLEEWKQIKSGTPFEIKSSLSPKHSKKHKEHNEKELQWFEKELSKIEKEKQRLERERQKFVEREEHLSKLRSAVVGGLKKEVLIHTSSGFHRFEGISRKFTQKLYEWEKSRGIAPESSTFALLKSSLVPPATKVKQYDTISSLVRSKSADSIAQNLACTTISHQPSSLSLNDVEELEKECLADSKASSLQCLSECNEMETEEPEALIVEIEDIVEETAAPLHTYAQRTQQPIYQREQLKTMCEGETCLGPKVRRSESTKAQNNYNLIEEIFSMLRNLAENEDEIQKMYEIMIDQQERSNIDLIKLKMFDESQKAIVNRLNDKIIKLQEANQNVFTNLANKEDLDFNPKPIIETLEVVQDLSSEIFQLTEKLELETNNRNVYDIPLEIGAQSLNPIPEIAKEIKNKMLELRRRLSYICAASDLTAPRRHHKNLKLNFLEQQPKEGRLFIKSEASTTQNQGAIKKKIKYRQKNLQSKSIADSDEEDDKEEAKRNTHKKLARTRSVFETETKLDGYQSIAAEEILVDPQVVEKVVVPTNVFNITSSSNEDTQVPDSPVTVLVKTTRKLFTPFVESTLGDKTIDLDQEQKTINKPPLPSSPVPIRKTTKDISPSIRLMLAKYNQKLSEQDLHNKSGGSSGSASPVAWRSPVSERRVKAQTEKYQQELNKGVQKSASVAIIMRQNSLQATPTENLLKSSSISAMPIQKPLETKNSIESDERQKKIQKAKEEFLNSEKTQEVKPSLPNRFSQISVDSGSSFGSECAGLLVKSASVGMINIDAETYRQFDPEMHGGGYVSLPRNTKKQKTGKFAFSNIANKFRKVKMRKGKEKNSGEMNTISTLCRQSLVVDIQPLLSRESDCKSEPSCSRSGSWMKKAKFFKK